VRICKPRERPHGDLNWRSGQPSSDRCPHNDPANTLRAFSRHSGRAASTRMFCQLTFSTRAEHIGNMQARRSRRAHPLTPWRDGRP
jgi:hypothetical protein